MRVLVASHPSSFEHDTGAGHPEKPQRIDAVLRGIDESGVDQERLVSPEITRGELGLVHDPEYISMIEMFCRLGGGALDMDTIASPESWEAALTAAGGIVAVTKGLRDGFDGFGFALTRPPGHHALADRAMGFCLFNNLAVAAGLLRAEGERVAILDWDVHHGNGTQSIVMDDPGTLYASLHQSPFYPFEGDVQDIDVGAAKGTTVNVPLPAGAAGDVYRRAWSEIVLPVVDQFKPDWVLVSAGYDAHTHDPLAELRLTSDDYGWLANRLAQIHDPRRTVVGLEGGYDLSALEESASATVQGFAGRSDWDDPLSSVDVAWSNLKEAKEAVSRHWSV